MGVEELTWEFHIQAASRLILESEAGNVGFSLAEYKLKAAGAHLSIAQEIRANAGMLYPTDLVAYR